MPWCQEAGHEMVWSLKCCTLQSHIHVILKRCGALLKLCCGSAPSQPTCLQGSLQTKEKDNIKSYPSASIKVKKVLGVLHILDNRKAGLGPEVQLLKA